MKNIIVSLLFVFLAFPVFTANVSGQDLKQKCNEGYRTCLKDCTKKHSRSKAAFLCQGDCYKKKTDCRKNARQGKKYTWEEVK